MINEVKHFGKILLHMYGSESSITAAKLAIALAKKYDCLLKAIYVVNESLLTELLGAKILVPAEKADFERALDAWDRGLQENPSWIGGLANRANELWALGRLEEEARVASGAWGRLVLAGGQEIPVDKAEKLLRSLVKEAARALDRQDSLRIGEVVDRAARKAGVIPGLAHA
jgi:nucleotide-binding universal stress UspA family protein